MLKKLFPFILLIVTIIFILQIPNLAFILSILSILISFAIALYNVFEKYKETTNSRIQITKDVLIFIVTFLLISFLGRVAGLFVNAYTSPIYGVIIGLLCAMLVSFWVGYLV